MGVAAMGRTGGTRFDQELRKALKDNEATARIEWILRTAAGWVGSIGAVVALDHEGADPDRLQETAFLLEEMADAYVERRRQPPPPWPQPDPSEDPDEPADWREARRPNARADRKARRPSQVTVDRILAKLPEELRSAGRSPSVSAHKLDLDRTTLWRALDYLETDFETLAHMVDDANGDPAPTRDYLCQAARRRHFAVAVDTPPTNGQQTGNGPPTTTG
jgi:hypothetical protein